MIVYLIGMIVKGLFTTVIGLMRLIFGTVWTTLSSKVTEVLVLPGVGAGLGLFDAFVGIDFIAWAVGLAVTIVVTWRMMKIVIGLFSRGV